MYTRQEENYFVFLFKPQKLFSVCVCVVRTEGRGEEGQIKNTKPKWLQHYSKSISHQAIHSSVKT